jgi:FkbM family methyltransferase
MMKVNSINSLLKTILRRTTKLVSRNSGKYLKKIDGLIHVGANTGQEIALYQKHGLSVVWIEPIPEIFDELQKNLSGFPKQIAVRGLVTDQEGKEYQFNLASNHGASSSILDFNLHQDIWPDITFQRTISLFSKTLPTLLSENNVDLNKYNMMVIDTQGSELLVLNGASNILHHFKYIQTEVPDFEAYKGCCQLTDLQEFFNRHHFKEVFRQKFATHPNGGNYYDVVFKRVSKI